MGAVAAVVMSGACGPVPPEEEGLGEWGPEGSGGTGSEVLGEPSEVSQMTFVGDLGRALGSPIATHPSTCTASNQWRTTCGSGSSRDISYVWTVPETGKYTFSTINSNFDTVMEIRHFTSTSSVMGCNDDTSTTPQSRVTLNGLVKGVQLLIIIEGFEGACGAVTLNIARLPS
ncbi:hypothetical protein LZ198_25060 [Myxococcus sp. K15C18031901]|uniref:hypothetical protein n=1 Tax=Myxococcus dinghuensis TaxID=2906761 RepID=UPI0020A6DE81|nr:hypothetical protein [Myxococcus dinghuensis]MCP3102143.1 hypothetical protein [Myxococcus dinghuensis]